MPIQVVSEVSFFSMPRAPAALYEKVNVCKKVLNGNFIRLHGEVVIS